MDKKIAALLSTVAGVAVMGSAQAATPAAAAPSQGQASSYAELLSPIPNAVEALKADDAAKAQKSEGEVELAQYYPNYGYGSYYGYGYGYRRYHHHHHHHHHHNWGWRPY